MNIRGFSRGQSMVEMALATPFLAVLLLIAADLMRVCYMSSVLHNAALAGAEYGAQSVTSAASFTDIKAAAQADASNLSNMTVNASNFCECAGATVSCSSAASCTTDERIYVQVKTAATFTPLIKYPGLPSSFPLSGEAIMRAQ